MRSVASLALAAGPPLIDSAMIFTAVALVWIVPVTLLTLWFATDDAKFESVFIFTAIVVSLLLSYGMGLFYSHPAPYVGQETLLSGPPENSFPSQHTTTIFAFVWPFFYFDRWRTGFAALALAALLGFSRVYVGLHYPIDIVGGIVASLAGFALVYAARDLVRRFTQYCVSIENRWWNLVRAE